MAIAGGAGEPGEVDVLAAGDRLLAGGLVDAVDEDEVIEIRRRRTGDARQRAELHQEAAVAVEDVDLALRLGEGQAEADGARAAHAAGAIKVVLAGRAGFVPGQDAAHHRHADGVVFRGGDQLDRVVTLHAVGAPIRATAGPRRSRLSRKAFVRFSASSAKSMR